MKKCIIFDADGMVFSNKRFSDIYAQTHALDTAQMLPFFTGPFQDALVGKADVHDAVAPYLKEWKWDGSAQEFVQHWIENQTNLDHDMIAYVEQLKDHDVLLVLATNNERHRAERMQKSVGHLFDRVLSSAHVGHKKPSREFYAHLRDALGDCEILFFDDDPKNIEGAKDAGLSAQLYVDLARFKNIVEEFLKA